MKISSVDVLPVSVPLTKPMRMSHVTLHATGNVLVRVESDTGHVGWGEGVEAMDVTGENQARITASIEAFRPRLIGLDPRRRTAIWRDLKSSVYGNSTAIGAIDIALHDLVGRAMGVPVVDLIGGAVRDRIPALTLLGSGDTDADVATFEERYERGLRWFKLKLGIGSPEVEAETLRRMLAHAGDVVACGDTNAGWTEAESARFLQIIEDLPVRFIEQPTRRHAAMARLSAHSPIPICADEGCRSLDDLPHIAADGLAGVSLKLIKHAGITGVMRGGAICDNLGLAVNLAGKIAETSIAAAANIHCAAAMSDTYFGCSPGNQGISADVTTGPLLPIDGIYEVPTSPGLGIEVDEHLVHALM
jgi:muconate cycloisomerase